MDTVERVFLASGKTLVKLKSESVSYTHLQCGTVLSAIQTTLGEESEVDWHCSETRRAASLPEAARRVKQPLKV